MHLPILYSFRRCPFAMRARLAIANSGQSVELREVVLKNKPDQLRAISSKATVPVLQISQDQIIDESLDIMHWAIFQGNSDDWLMPDTQQNDLIHESDYTFKYWLDRYKYADRHTEYSMIYYREKCEEFLIKLEGLLGKNKYFMSDQLSFSDIAIFPFVRQFAHVDREWFFQSEYLNLQAWLVSLIESELFKSIMFKHTPWAEGDKVIYFPSVK